MTNEEIIAYQQADREFRATEVGKLFTRFETAAATLWQSDTLDLSYPKMQRIDDAHRAAREALIAKLRRLELIEAALKNAVEELEHSGLAHDHPSIIQARATLS